METALLITEIRQKSKRMAKCSTPKSSITILVEEVNKDGNPNDDVGDEELEPQEHFLSASSAAGSCVTFNKGAVACLLASESSHALFCSGDSEGHLFMSFLLICKKSLPMTRLSFSGPQFLSSVGERWCLAGSWASSPFSGHFCDHAADSRCGH